MTNGLYTFMKKVKHAFTGKPKYATGGFTTVVPYRTGVLMDSTAPGLEQGTGSRTRNHHSPFLCRGVSRAVEFRSSRAPTHYAPMPSTPPKAAGSGSTRALKDAHDKIDNHIAEKLGPNGIESLSKSVAEKVKRAEPLAEFGIPGPPRATDPFPTKRSLSSGDLRGLADAITRLTERDTGKRIGDRLPDRVLVDKVADARRADRLFGCGFAEWSSAPTREIHSGDSHGIPVQAKINGVLVHGFLDRIEGQKDAIKAMKIVAVPAGVYVETDNELLTMRSYVEEDVAIREEDGATLVITGGRYLPDEGTLKTWSA